eukprot:CAMPEP_0119028924 /NCGR_PEP_ID=MMETSP1176-20130426/39821_1 /TAXON_ID=265551 /ORGANISM="Synedropsis recta cf, Strain CCMP1620" /LENGTH=245 /DNA_ID=CAMNT_0006985175 /DNA_START=5 /DNA_END=742 /DNA_ORIENTATION=+
MKLSVAVLSTCLLANSSVNAFAPASSMSRSSTTFGVVTSSSNSRLFSTESDSEAAAAATTDFESAMPTTEDEYTRFGVSKDEIGLGVDVNELLQWCGTKEDIIGKVMRDNRGLSREEAEDEVSRLLMDVEIVQRVLFFERNKDQINLKEQAEQNLSDPNTIGTYAVWLIGGASFPYLRRRFIDPKFASGEWDEFHINIDKFLPGGGGGGAAADAVAAPAAEAVQSAAELVSSVSDHASDIISNAM